MAIAAVAFLQASSKSFHELNDIAFNRYRLASDLIDATQNAHRMLLKTLSIAANEADQDRIKASVRASFAADDEIAGQLLKLERLFPQGEGLVVQIRPLFDSYRGAAKDVLDAAQSDPASATLLTFAADRGADNLLSGLENFKASANQFRTESATHTAGLLTRGYLWLSIILCLALLSS